MERIVRAAEITPLPRSPEIILGIIDIQGEVVPVIDVRKRFRRPARELCPADQFIIARARGLKIALVVDAALEVVEDTGADRMPEDDILTGIEYVAGVTRTKEGLVLIHDLDRFLSAGEEDLLLQAMAKRDG